MANEKRTTKRGRKRMDMVKKIAKNIGVIVLAIAVLFVASLVAGLCATPFEHAPYVGLIVQCLVAIVATLALAWLVSTKILKVAPIGNCVAGSGASILCIRTSW